MSLYNVIGKVLPSLLCFLENTLSLSKKKVTVTESIASVLIIAGDNVFLPTRLLSMSLFLLCKKFHLSVFGLVFLESCGPVIYLYFEFLKASIALQSCTEGWRPGLGLLLGYSISGSLTVAELLPLLLLGNCPKPPWITLCSCNCPYLPETLKMKDWPSKMVYTQPMPLAQALFGPTGNVWSSYVWAEWSFVVFVIQNQTFCEVNFLVVIIGNFFCYWTI